MVETERRVVRRPTAFEAPGGEKPEDAAVLHFSDSMQKIQGNCLLATLAVASLLGSCAPAMYGNGRADQAGDAAAQVRRAESALKQTTDNLFATALKAGKAIMVIPTASLDSIKFDFNNNDSTAEFLRLRSAVTEWRNVEHPESVIKVGYETDARQLGMARSHFQNVFGQTLFEIYLVEPGTYTLAGASHDLPRTEMFNPPGGRGNRPSSLGSVVLQGKQFDEFDRSRKWEDATYRNETVQESRCSAVRVVNNECVSWAKTSYDVKQKTGDAGWVSSIQKRSVDARSESVRLSKDFAKFSVAPDEAVLVDGFFADPPGARFFEESCKQATQQAVQCGLAQISLVRMPGAVEDFRKAEDPANYGYPKMSEVLKSVTSRQIKVMAAESNAKSRWGRVYTLKAN
jgi:hypothetical protein